MTTDILCTTFCIVVLGNAISQFPSDNEKICSNLCSIILKMTLMAKLSNVMPQKPLYSVHQWGYIKSGGLNLIHNSGIWHPWYRDIISVTPSKHYSPWSSISRVIIHFHLLWTSPNAGTLYIEWSIEECSSHQSIEYLWHVSISSLTKWPHDDKWL